MLFCSDTIENVFNWGRTIGECVNSFIMHAELFKTMISSPYLPIFTIYNGKNYAFVYA